MKKDKCSPDTKPYYSSRKHVEEHFIFLYKSDFNSDKYFEN